MSDVSEPYQPGQHYPALDGLRAFAIIAVVIHHCLQIPNEILGAWTFPVIRSLWCGVDLFFVLSGFLITGILLDTRSHSNRWLVFVARRTLRVFPLYYFWLFVVFVVLPLFSTTFLPAPKSAEPWLWSYLFNISIWIHQAYPAEPCLNHCWSLAVEEQFYLLWPLVVFTVPARRLGAACLLGIAAAIFLKFSMITKPNVEWAGVYTLTATRMDALLGGGFIAWALRNPDAIKTQRLHLILSLLGIGIFGLLISTNLYGYATVLNKLTFCILTSFYALSFPLLLLYLLKNPKAYFTRMLNWKPFGFVARLSYGIYISHSLVWFVLILNGRPFLKFLEQKFNVAEWASAFAILVLATVGISWILYEVLERPLLGLKRYFPYEKQETTQETPVVETAGSQAV